MSIRQIFLCRMPRASVQSKGKPFIDAHPYLYDTNRYKGKYKNYPPDVVARFRIEPPHPVGIFILLF